MSETWQKPEWWDAYQEELKHTQGLPRKRYVCPICGKLLEIKEKVFALPSPRLCKECKKKHEYLVI